MDFFSNPFSSQVGQRIEAATVENPGSDSLILHLEICDIINENEEGAQDALKALKKRLFGQKNWAMVMQALTVLEVCVKNCGHRFHLLISKKEFMDQLVALSSPKTSPPTVVRERVLGLIQVWADSFRGRYELEPVCTAYDELRRTGVEFPAQDLDALAPIYTPHRSVPEPTSQLQSSAPNEPTHVDISTLNQGNQQAASTANPPSQGYPPTSGVSAPHAYPQLPGQQYTPPQQLAQPPVQQQPILAQQAPEHPPQLQSPTGQTTVAKIRSELDVVERNASVFHEMIQVFVPGDEATADYDLFMQLHTTCREMQSRIMQLLSSQADEALTVDLLTANDTLNVCFESYEAYQTARSAALPDAGVMSAAADVTDGPPTPNAIANSASPAVTPAAAQPVPSPEPVSLIDFDAPAEPSQPPQPGPRVAMNDDVAARLSQLGIEPPPYTAMAGVGTSAQPSNVNVDTSPRPEEEEFDMFAASRQAGFTQPSNAYETPDQAVSFSGALNSRNPFRMAASEPHQSPTSGSSTYTPPGNAAPTTATAPPPAAAAATASSSTASESANISQWLAANNLQSDMEIIEDKAVDDIEPMSTEEFDMFLSSRTAGKKKAETVKVEEKKPARRARPMMKHDDDDADALFAL